MISRSASLLMLQTVNFRNRRGFSLLYGHQKQPESKQIRTDADTIFSSSSSSCLSEDAANTNNNVNGNDNWWKKKSNIGQTQSHHQQHQYQQITISNNARSILNS